VAVTTGLFPQRATSGRHVLVARAGALGDLVLLRRTIAALVSAGDRVSLLAPDAAAALVGPGEAAQALPWDGPEMAALLAGETTGGPVESALLSAHVVIAYTRSLPVLDALRRHAGRLVPRDPAPPPGGPHASAWLAGALSELGLEAREDPPPLLFTEAETAGAEAATSRLPRGFVAVHPGSGSRAKNWPLERFVAAARRLSRRRPWLLVLGPAEADVVAPPDAVVASALPLRRLGAILARAGLFVGNDSGVAHLAAACGTRTLALFGPTDPAVWAPVGRAVRTLRAAGRRLEDLGVDEVVEAGRALTPGGQADRGSFPERAPEG
jgi:heptosyltransferase-3